MAAVGARNLELQPGPRLPGEVVACGVSDALPVVVVDDEQRLVGEPRLDGAEPPQLLLVAVRAVVVVDPDAPVAQRPALEQLERVSLEDGRAVDAEAAEVLLERLPGGGGQLPALHLERPERERVDRDEVALVPSHRADQARTQVGADLDVALAGGEQAGRQVEQGEHVLLGEVRDAGDDVVEARAPRVRRAGEVLEELRELGREALDVHRGRNLAASC